MMKKLIRTLQSELPFAKPLKDSLGRWARRALRRPHDIDFAALALLPDGVYIDVGANNGQSIESIRLYRPGAEIMSFEPNPRLADKLKHRYGHDPLIRISSFGLSDTVGSAVLHVPRYGGFVYDALASLDRNHAAAWIGPNTVYWFRPKRLEIETVWCRACPLDSLGLDPVFIKIDVEGLESTVLAGALETLRRHQPVVLLEYDAADARPHDILDALGYREYAYDGARFQPGPSPAWKANSFFIPTRYAAALGVAP